MTKCDSKYGSRWVLFIMMLKRTTEERPSWIPVICGNVLVNFCPPGLRVIGE